MITPAAAPVRHLFLVGKQVNREIVRLARFCPVGCGHYFTQQDAADHRDGAHLVNGICADHAQAREAGPVA